MEQNTIPRCHTCHFWLGDRKREGTQGECHAAPPQIAGLVPQQNMAGQTIPVAVSAFPTCNGMTWCGIWKQAGQNILGAA